jgi:hypothetical protein
MNKQEWLKQIRIAGGILIKEGEWAAEITDDKKAINKDVKDRLKKGVPSIETDAATGKDSIHVLKSKEAKGYLTNVEFYQQIDDLLALYEVAIGGVAAILPPWGVIARVPLKRDDVLDVVKASNAYTFAHITANNGDHWQEVVGKDISLFGERIATAIQNMLLYIDLKAEEIATYNTRNRPKSATSIAESDPTEF